MAELTNAVKNIDGKLRFLEFLGEETEEIIEKNERKSITRQIKAYESKLEEIEELKLNIQELKIQAEEEPQEVRNWRKCISEKQKQFEPLLERLQTAIRGFEENDKKNKQQEKEQEYEKEISLEKMKLQQRFEMEKQLIATRGQTKMEKFDDELVDTSNPFKRLLSSRRSSESSQPDQKATQLKKSVPRIASSTKKLAKKVKPQVVTADFGRWRPTDDMTLIVAIQQVNDLEAVHLGVKFSCCFTLREIQERWYALLYDPVVSKLAQQAMKQLPINVIESIQAIALWSKEEESLLSQISSNSSQDLLSFEKLFNQNQSIFHKSRTAKSLLNHWLLMRHYQLLIDQSGKTNETDINLHDIEARLSDDEIMMSKNESFDKEMNIVDKRQKRELKRLENDIPQWMVIADELTGCGTNQSEFDPQTLAVLRGRVVRYLMRSKEITFGRNASDVKVDIDFSLEGPTCKISRKQGIITLANDGKFLLHNQGRRPIFINGTPVVHGSVIQLQHNSSLELCGLKFLFLINPELKKTREEAQENLNKTGKKKEDNIYSEMGLHVDVSSLSQEECSKIITVLAKDIALRRSDEERIRDVRRKCFDWFYEAVEQRFKRFGSAKVLRGIYRCRKGDGRVMGLMNQAKELACITVSMTSSRRSSILQIAATLTTTEESCLSSAEDSEKHKRTSSTRSAIISSSSTDDLMQKKLQKAKAPLSRKVSAPAKLNIHYSSSENEVLIRPLETTTEEEKRTHSSDGSEDEILSASSSNQLTESSEDYKSALTLKVFGDVELIILASVALLLASLLSLLACVGYIDVFFER
eukprot:gene17403-19146_t